MSNVWIDSAGAVKESVFGLRSRIFNTHQLARQILFGSLLHKAPDVRVEVIKLILVQYLALCSGPKVLALFVRIGRTRSLVELFQLRIACYEKIALQHHQSLAQEMVDLVDAALYRRRSIFDPPCRLNIEPGVKADFERVGCG